MATLLHLKVLQSVVGTSGDPTQVRIWNTERTEFVWNTDFTAFRPVALRWWDDASYIVAELFGGPDHGGREDGPDLGSTPPAIVPAAPAAELDFDEIPF